MLKAPQPWAKRRARANQANDASRTFVVAAILVHAISEDAKRFYLSRGFRPSPLQDMTLCLPLETARRGLKTRK